jgi:PBSX family phage terminase large subunit
MSFSPGIFSEKQLDVMANCTANANFLEGAVRSGKTIATILAFLTALTEFPKDSNILLIGKTITSLIRNIIKPLEEITGKTHFKYTRGIGEGFIFGRLFYAAGANDERAYTKIQGLTLALALGDEVALWPESFFKMLMSRLSDWNARFIGTTNPESPYHWLKVEYIDRADELDIKVWHFDLEDNKNLPPKYVENLKKLYTGLWHKRYIQGLWVLAEGTVYDMFDEAYHVAEIAQETWDKCLTKYVSIDYGTTNPCVFHLWGVLGAKKYLKKEYYYDSKAKGKQKTDNEFVMDLKEFLNGESIKSVIVDPSAASFKAELRLNGFSVVDAVNDVLDGIRETAKEMMERLIIIDKSCKNTIMEFGGYIWDVKACQRGDEKPLKTSDHCMDSLRYFIMTLFMKLGGKPVYKTSFIGTSFSSAGTRV